jgi:hydroxyacylglutathione hydrolase
MINMNQETQLIDLGFVNAYLLKAADGYILIDTGVSQQWSRLESELLQAGCLPSRLKLVVITHGDFDHTGNCAELKRKYHVKIAMHSGDVQMVKTGLPLPVKRKARGLRGKLFLWLGRRMIGNFPVFEPDIILEDGQDLSEYGLAARVIYTPGHTKGSIAVLTADGRLFAGDTFSNRGKPAGAPFIANKEELRNSIAALKRTQAHTVYPGHGKPFAFDELASIRG